MADSKEPKLTVRFYEPINDGVALFSMAHPGSQDLNPEALEELEIELDDPYLELFDRINQLEMDIKELSAKFDKYIDVTLQQRAYNARVIQGMPVGGAAMGDDGVNNINSHQSEFKFFE